MNIDAIFAAASVKKKTRKTPAQAKALRAYNFALAQEDRFLGSVFANRVGAARHAGLVALAYQACLKLGMTHEHGL